MPRTRYTPEQIITKLRQAEGELARGQSAAEGCRKIGTSEQTYSRWRKEYGGLRVDHLKRLKAWSSKTAACGRSSPIRPWRSWW